MLQKQTEAYDHRGTKAAIYCNISQRTLPGPYYLKGKYFDLNSLYIYGIC